MHVLQEVQIELVGFCNIKCSYCTWTERSAGKQLMESELAYRLIGEASQMSPRPLVTFHAVGESTLHPDLLPLLAMGQHLGLGMRLSTNCTLLTGEMAQYLTEFVNLEMILAMHQGVAEKTKLKCRKNALDFLNGRPRCRSLEVLFVCAREAAAFAPEIIDSFLLPVERNPQARLHFKQPQTWPMAEPQHGFVPSVPDHPQIFVDRIATPRSLGRGCSMPEYLLNVSADGMVAPCCVALESWGLPHAREGLEKIWNSVDMDRIRERWHHKSDLQPCGHCLKREDC